MLPDQAHLYEQDWTIFFLHRDAEQAEGKEVDSSGLPPLIYVLNLVITKHDATVKRYVPSSPVLDPTLAHMAPMCTPAAQKLKRWRYVHGIPSCTYIK